MLTHWLPWQVSHGPQLSTHELPLQVWHGPQPRVEDGLHVIPCSFFLFEDRGVSGDVWDLLSRRLGETDLWRLRGAAFGEGPEPRTRSACAAQVLQS